MQTTSIRINCACLVSLLALAATGAGASSLSLGGRIDSQTLAIQRKADELYEAGDFERSFSIYRNELAPLGDKYAQYMVGFMLLAGEGVEPDPILASAWYRLAAERGIPQFERERDELLERLGEPDRVRSDAAYTALRAQYSDLVLLLDLLEDDFDTLAPRTGSRLARSGSQGTSVDPRTGSMVATDVLRMRAHERAEEKLRAIRQLLGTDIETDPGKVDLAELERVVQREIATISDR